MSSALLDTDVLSALMRGQPVALDHASEYLAVNERFTFSIITRYEILRGLKAKRASVQIEAFDRFTAANHVLPITDAIIVRASGIYADLYQRGDLIGDADILIAATALEHDCRLVTNNTRHFWRTGSQPDRHPSRTAPTRSPTSSPSARSEAGGCDRRGTMRQVILYPGEDGYWVAECPSLPGCISQGETRESAVVNIREAISAYVAALQEDGIEVPEERFETLVVAV